jgi:hypothetical protein
MSNRNLQTYLALTLSLGCLLVLSGCGLRAGPPATVTTAITTSTAPAAPAEAVASSKKITGHVSTPTGLLGDQTVPTPTGFFDDLLIKPAYAFADVSFAAGISVGVYASDPYGVAVGEPIVVAETDDNGYYEAALPDDYIADPSLVIQVGYDGDDDSFRMRRMCTGISYQDVSLDTEVGLQCVLANTDTYPVDVRFIEPEQYEVVYTNVGTEFVNYDPRPIMLRYRGHRRQMFDGVVAQAVVQVRAQPAVWGTVRESVQGSYETASVRGHGLVLVNRQGGVAVAGPAVRPGHAMDYASRPMAVSDQRAEQQRGFIAAGGTAQARPAIASRGAAQARPAVASRGAVQPPTRQQPQTEHEPQARQEPQAKHETPARQEPQARQQPRPEHEPQARQEPAREAPRAKEPPAREQPREEDHRK